jgi:hypothetical protein
MPEIASPNSNTTGDGTGGDLLARPALAAQAFDLLQNA